MDDGLHGWAEMGSQQMSIQIATEKEQLEKEHAGCPDRRRATKPREYAFADDGLNLEDQEGTEKRRGGKPKERESWIG